MRLFSYVVEHDYGFAPNPFHGVCSLAACKPKIRSCAQVGDYVVGTGCAQRGRKRYDERRGFLVYYMRITEVMTFDDYWDSERFRIKRPFFTGSKMHAFGDNIYHRDTSTVTWLQEMSFHSLPNGDTHRKNLMDDTGTTDRVLLSSDFGYWGESGPKVPQHLRQHCGDLVCNRGHKSNFTEDFVSSVVSWLGTLGGHGVHGRPANWRDVLASHVTPGLASMPGEQNQI